MSRILIASHHFYPEINPRAFRASALCKELRRRGYAVDVVYGDTKKVILSEELDEYFACAASTPAQTPSASASAAKDSLLKQAFRFFIAEKFIITRLPWMKRVLDLSSYNGVISVGTPFYVHIAVADALKKNGKEIPSVCDNGDPFYNYKKRDKAFYFGILQRMAFSAFDFVCTPIEDAVDYYAKYVSQEKVKVVPQGYDVSNVRLADYERCDIPTFAFAGRFYKDIRNPQSLLSALCSIQHPFRFLVFSPKEGDVYHEVLEPYQKQLGERLILRGMIPREDCIYELSKVDFLINLENRLTIQSPSKVVDYALSKRPILSFSQDEVSREKLEEWLNGSYTNPLCVDITPFDIQNVCLQFEDMMGLTP